MNNSQHYVSLFHELPMNTSQNFEHLIHCYFLVKCVVSHLRCITYSNFRTLDGELGSSLLSRASNRVEPMALAAQKYMFVR